jgi:predicted Ser/Thr protein kinase
MSPNRTPPPGEPTEADATGDPMEEMFLREAAHAPDEAPPPRLVGQTLGRYRVASLLGKGGMGVVYYAQDTKLRRPVALKVLPPALVADPERRRRFLREARSAAAVTHPGIAAVYDVGEESGNVFLAMEYVEGKTLRALLRERTGGLPSPQVARIGCDIAVALAKAHAVGVIHRDLKPENVMLSEDGIVKILDFGLAKLRETEVSEVSETATAGHLTEAGRVMGTPHYMSPEQALGKPVDERTDVFSLGVMLYELCSGRLPFSGATDMEAIVSRTRDDPRPLRELRPEVVPELVQVIDRCLRKSAAGRYASAAALAADLRPLASPSIEGLAGGGSHLSVPPAALPSRTRARRRWPWVGLAAVVACAITFAMLRRDDHRGSPLLAEDAKIACPILETEDASHGWLGAAAAHLACGRAATLRGGLWDHALTPAMLLDLPRQPLDSFPEDPFAARDARARTVAAARTRAAAYLDGRVVATDTGFHVSLVLNAGDRTLARGEGSGEALWQAARAAMTPLVGPDAIPRASRLHPHVAGWLGLSDVELALMLEDGEASFWSGVAIREARARLESRRAELGTSWTLMSFSLALVLGEPTDLVPPDIDRSSPQAFARTAGVRLVLGGSGSPAALADELAAMGEKMTDPLERRAARLAEADLRLGAGDNDRARNLVLSVLPEEPRLGWHTLMGASHSRIGQVSVARGRAAWEPSASDGWNSLSYTSDRNEPHKKLEFMRRAYALSPGTPLFASQLGRMLVLAGEREEARALAAKTAAADKRMHFVSEGITIEVEASESRFATALARAQKALLARSDFGRIETGDIMVWPDAAELAMVLGREAEVAEAFVRRFVLVDPPRIQPFPMATDGVVLACALASPRTAAPCFARLRKLIDTGHFRGAFERTAPFLAGAERYAQRDFKGAAAAWRALANEPPSGRTWLVLGDAFDRAGEPEIAERIDRQGPYMGLIGGLSIAHLRMARRAAARGDTARAKELAQKIVDSWGVADTPVPAVAEMRALVARLR